MEASARAVTSAQVSRSRITPSDSFRRFIKDIGAVYNPEYAVDLSKGLPMISDYGNI